MLAKVTVVKIANYGTSVCGEVAAAGVVLYFIIVQQKSVPQFFSFI